MTPQAGLAERVIASMKPELDLAAEQKRLIDVWDSFFWEQIERCYPYTLLSTEKMYNLYEAVRYLALRKVPGAIVECGVFLGGAMMLTAETLSRLGVTDKDIYLYDTFAGFVGESTEHDINHVGRPIGHQKLQNFLELTRDNMEMTSYPKEHYVFLEGDVRETVLEKSPDQISLLRLDTDTYETTLSELENLYPKLVKGGVLLLDDYGYSKGVRKAVDDYFDTPESVLFFQRANFSSRTAIKL